MIIVSTSSPEHIFPATACLVQDRLGARKPRVDLLAACSGFISPCNMATQAIRSGSVNNALVIGAKTLSRLVDWKDRETCISLATAQGLLYCKPVKSPAAFYLPSCARMARAVMCFLSQAA